MCGRVLWSQVCILDGFTKLWKMAISFIVYVCLSVHELICGEQIGSHWMHFYEILYLSIFQKSVE
jgi:hypothetical protein